MKIEEVIKLTSFLHQGWKPMDALKAISLKNNIKLSNNDIEEILSHFKYLLTSSVFTLKGATA